MLSQDVDVVQAEMIPLAAPTMLRIRHHVEVDLGGGQRMLVRLGFLEERASGMQGTVLCGSI